MNALLSRIRFLFLDYLKKTNVAKFDNIVARVLRLSTFYLIVGYAEGFNSY